MENRVVRLARGKLKIKGDKENAVHNSNTGFDRLYSAVWRGYGPLQIADGVAVVGLPGLRHRGLERRVRRQAEGDALHL